MCDETRNFSSSWLQTRTTSPCLQICVTEDAFDCRIIEYGALRVAFFFEAVLLAGIFGPLRPRFELEICQ